MMRRFPLLRSPSSAAALATPSLDHHLNKQERATLWGATSGTFVEPGDSAQKFLSRMHYDAVVSKGALRSPTLSRTQEDALGTDLNLPANNNNNNQTSTLLKESENLYKTERGSQFLSALRRTRARGAGSSVGFARLSSPRDATDEADRPETTWSRDNQFIEASSAINDITGVSAPNMETLMIAMKRATPEQLKQLYSGYRGLQPYSFLPVPSEAGWALSGEDLEKWCEKSHSARSEADKFNADVLNNAVVAAGGFSSIAGKLADQFNKVCAINKARRERQVKAGAIKEWSKMTQAEKEASATQDITRQILAEQSGEYDAAGEDDTSEEFLVEHDNIEKIVDEDLGGGVTFRKFWLSNERLFEAVTLQHLSDANSTELRAACLLRARNELPGGQDRIDKDLEQSIRNSTFDSKGHFVTPDMTPLGWRMTRWHLFGASKTVVQHTSSSSRILDCRYQSLEGSAAVAKLYYRLLPLSSALDLSSPFRHRKSLVSVGAEFMMEIDRSNQIRAVKALRTLDNTVIENDALVSVVAAPFGATRRLANEALRADLTKNDVKLNKIAFGKTIQDAKETPSSSAVWKMGTYQDVAFDWPTPLLDATDPLNTTVLASPGSVDAALSREKNRQQRTCLTVALMRKRTSEQIESAKKQLEKDVLTPLAEARKSSSSPSSLLLPHVRRQLERVSGLEITSDAALDKAVSLLQKEAEQQEWEFVRMLDDVAQPYPGESSVKIRMPFFSDEAVSSSSSSQHYYRLDVRAFDLHKNPKRLPTRFVSKSSAPFTISDPVPAVMKKVAKVNDVDEKTCWTDSNNNNKNNEKITSSFNGNLLIDLCSALRKEGIDIPLMLEFEAGQNLTGKGEILTSYFLSLLAEGNSSSNNSKMNNIKKDLLPNPFFRQAGVNHGITDLQLSIEPAVRRHYELHRPGATNQEWAENRRSILESAMTEEAEWWRQDSLLQLIPETLSPVASPSRDAIAPDFTAAQATVRYGRDVAQVLHAVGRDGGLANQDDASAPVARVAMRGDGSTVSLDINQAVVTDKGLKLDQVLNAVKEASNAAQVRLNTLVEAKIGNTVHAAQREILDIADSTDLGGVYGKTVVRSFQQAEEQISAATGVGRIAQLDNVVRKEDDVVDRFASKDDVILRKGLFAHRVGPMGENAEEANHNDNNSSALDEW